MNSSHHEEELRLDLRTLPKVSLAIIVLCILIHLFTAGSVEKKEEELGQKLFETESFFYSNQNLIMDPEIKKMFFSEKVKQVFGKIEEKIAEDQDRNEKSEEAKKHMDQTIKMFEEMAKGIARQQGGSQEGDEEGEDDAQEDSTTLVEKQAHLDNLTDEVKLLLDSIPTRKYGFTPARRSMFSLLTYPFFHTGWIVLLINMWIIFYAGTLLENNWGKIIYGVILLLSALVGGVVYALKAPHFNSPLLGTSTVIAGIFGVLVIRYFHKVWKYIAVWLILQFLAAKLLGYVGSFGVGDGGAQYWAQMVTFALGILLAFGVRYLHLEEKNAPKTQKVKDTPVQADALYDKVQDLSFNGRNEEAYSLLMDAVAKDVLLQFPQVLDLLWSVSLNLNKTDDTIRTLAGILEKNIRSQKKEEIISYYNIIKNLTTNPPMSTMSQVTLIDYLVEAGSYGDAIELARQMLKQITPDSPPGILTRFCEAALKLQPHAEIPIAAKVIDLCLKCPQILPETKEELKAKLAAAGPLGAAAAKPGFQASSWDSPPPRPPDDTVIPVPPPPEEQVIKIDKKISRQWEVDNPDSSESAHLPGSATPAANSFAPPPMAEPASPVENPMDNMVVDGFNEIDIAPPVELKIVPAVPLELMGNQIKIDAQELGLRAVTLERVKAIAVARITLPTGKAFLVIDLCLGLPKSGVSKIQTIRLQSTDFNPMKFVPGAPSPLEAFRGFILQLLQFSGAKPLPNLEAVHLKKILSFPSLAEYENAILR